MCLIFSLEHCILDYCFWRTWWLKILWIKQSGFCVSNILFPKPSQYKVDWFKSPVKIIEVCSELSCCKGKQTLPSSVLCALSHGWTGVLLTPGPASVCTVSRCNQCLGSAGTLPWLKGGSVGPVHRCVWLARSCHFNSCPLCPVTNRSHSYPRPRAVLRLLSF